MISDEKFPRKERLLKTKDFKSVYKKGALFKSDSFFLYCMPNMLKNNRIGFSISSRNIKLASSRNRIRRLFREVYRRRKKDLKTGFDMVLVLKKDLGRAISYKEVEGLFLKLAKGANLLA